MNSVVSFNFNEIFAFFTVLVRMSVLFAILPFLGDSAIPGKIKILLALAVSLVIYPTLVSNGVIVPSRMSVWTSSASGIIQVITLEALFALALGFSAKIIFMAIQIGGDIIGNFMGFASASQFDPHQESQSQIVAKLLTTLMLLLFLVMDGHHLMLKAALRSYEIIGIGKVVLGGTFSERILTFSGEMIRIGMQLGAPMALSLFAINIVYGVFAKAMPQMNILILSLSVSAFVGLFVLLVSLPEFQSTSRSLFSRIGDEMGYTMESMQGP